MKRILLAPIGMKTNWSDWSDFRNAFGSKEYKPKRPPSKKLVAAAEREFECFCETYHIDATAYKYIEPTEIEGDWRQFDFKDSAEMDATAIKIHSIIEKNGKIYQRGY